MLRKEWPSRGLRLVARTRFRSTTSGKCCEEVRIPVPWGRLAGKWWGATTVRPILAFHGWQDNCGSFDRLIPLLPDQVSYLALDLPGHGLSSRNPVGQFYHSLSGVMLIRRLQAYFNWEQVSLMGHSLGSVTAFTFAGLYPSCVDFLICLDGLSPFANPKRLHRVTASIDDFLKYDQHVVSNLEPPAHTKEEMGLMLYKGSRESIDLDKCIHMLERNVLPSVARPGKYFFSRDPRIKSDPLINWPLEDIFGHAARVQMPTCVTLAEQQMMPIYVKVINILRKNPHFEMHQMKGRHHAHFNSPEQYREVIGNFIRKSATTDRTIKDAVYDGIRYQGESPIS